MLFTLIEIVQTDQFAKSYVELIVVVVDGTRRIVKICACVRHCRIAKVKSVRRRAAGAPCILVIGSHVIEHYVDENSHVDVVAPANHVPEFLRRTRSRVPDVRYRLITFPPRSVGYNYVFLNRGNLQQFIEIPFYESTKINVPLKKVIREINCIFLFNIIFDIFKRNHARIARATLYFRIDEKFKAIFLLITAHADMIIF